MKRPLILLFFIVGAVIFAAWWFNRTPAPHFVPRPLSPAEIAIRDRADTRVRRIVYGILALGWRGSARQWHRYERAYLILAALSTPLVLSVHSVVSFDFATAQLPGWHATIFPPYFVAGAIFSGFAMVVTQLIPAREFFGLKNVIEMRHLEQMNKIILATGTMVG